MKAQTIRSFACLMALAIAGEAFAQARSRSSEGRTSSRTGESSSRGSSSSGSSSSGSSSRGGYSSGSSSSGSSSSGSSSSGSSYSGGSSSSGGSYSSGSSYDYRPSRQRTQAPSTRRPAPVMSGRQIHDPIRSGQVRNIRNYTSSGTYKPAVHRPTTYERIPTRVRYQAARDYHHNIHRSYIYVNWVLYPSHYRYGEGHCYYDDYDWYVYQGYRHRYSDEDKCVYELLDTRTNTVVQSFKEGSCKQTYDDCAIQRDILIGSADYYDLKDYYVCAEKVEETLENPEATKLPNVISALPAKTVAELSEFIKENNAGKLYKYGTKSLNGCKIEKAPRNEGKCNYMVTVDGKPYPDPDGKVCSNRRTTYGYGCSSNSQRGNAACLLSLAVMEGLCLNDQGTLGL